MLYQHTGWKVNQNILQLPGFKLEDLDWPNLTIGYFNSTKDITISRDFLEKQIDPEMWKRFNLDKKQLKEQLKERLKK